MGLDDKMSNAAEDAKGKAKEAVGGATNDDELERQVASAWDEQVVSQLERLTDDNAAPAMTD